MQRLLRVTLNGVPAAAANEASHAKTAGMRNVGRHVPNFVGRRDPLHFPSEKEALSESG